MFLVNKEISMENKMQLSILFGRPMTPMMTPEAMLALQSLYMKPEEQQKRQQQGPRLSMSPLGEQTKAMTLPSQRPNEYRSS